MLNGARWAETGVGATAILAKAGHLAVKQEVPE